MITKYKNHAFELAQESIKENPKAVVAVGGDGTVNEVARAMMGSSIPVGILPCGSGNGLAGHLGISKSVNKALVTIQQHNLRQIDLIRVNTDIACNTAGLGFDGFVAEHFGKNGKRGFASYLNLGLKHFKKYPAFHCDINGEQFEQLLSLEVANSSQLGNKAIISPLSSVCDGTAEVVCLTKPKSHQLPSMFYRVFGHSFHKSKLTQIRSLHSAQIKLDRMVEFHVDGEFKGKTQHLHFEILNKALTVIVPSTKKI